jgi:MFS family permease
LWAAAAVSNLGDGVMAVAFPLLVASITRDPLLVAGATVANRIPWLLFALPAGAFVDQLDRRRVMVTVDWFRGVAVGLLGVLLVFGDAPLLVIYVVAFVLGSAETMFDTASEAIIPSLVGSDRLDSANGRLQAAEWAANNFVGPPFGAVLFAAAAAVPFLFDAATFLFAAVLVAAIGGSYRGGERVGEGPGGLGREIGAGLRWMWRHTVLRTLAMMAGVTNLVGTGIMAVFVLFAQDILGLGDVGYGLVMAAIGAGGLIGALTAPIATRRFGQGTALLSTLILMAAGTFVMGATSSGWVAGAIAGVFGFLIAMWNVVAVSLRQGLTPDPLRGRVASVARLLAWGTQPLGALLGGVIAAGFGLRGPFFLAGGVWVVVFGLTVPIVNNRRIEALTSRPDTLA